MFTGIIAAVGRIEKIEPLGAADAGLRLSIEAGALGLDDVALGDSIAIQGACMTVVQKAGNSFAIDISRESLSKTIGLDALNEVNLEKAVSLSTKLGGHLVTGHVDGIGEVMKFAAVGESHELVVRAPKELARFIAYKGSVTVNGVSLTVNSVDDVAGGADFSINLIPHTIGATTLKALAPGVKVNLEIDLIARYVERMLSAK
ncbi:MAG: ribC [Betaproteobacteria bacterium]|nr:ribC [Betaproteobacteria bacterium]